MKRFFILLAAASAALDMLLAMAVAESLGEDEEAVPPVC